MSNTSFLRQLFRYGVPHKLLAVYLVGQQLLQAGFEVGIRASIKFVVDVAIAHRLSTICHADRIYVIAAGRIIQQGNYEELANQEGWFANLLSNQGKARQKSSTASSTASV